MICQFCSRVLKAALVFGIGWGAPVAGAADPFEWPTPVPENRPATIWWWLGNGVDRENLTANLEELRGAGMGGVTVVPIYGVKGAKKIELLSPEWEEMLDHAIRESDRLGLTVDMTTGSGWPFGGPMVDRADADVVVTYEDGELGTEFSGRRVKRAAPGGEGFSLNPYSPAAMRRYLGHFDEVMDSVARPRGHYHDSFEYAGNWSSEVPAAFRARHGYDLLGHLPALFGEGDPDGVARIKADYRAVLSDLHLAYVQTWVGWAESRGMTTREQAHGAPANLLDLYAAAGIPETEIFGATAFEIPGIRLDPEHIRSDSPQPLINRMASSAAHVAGRRLVSSETCTWLRNHFRTALSQVKPEVDQLFLAGINHVFFHGTTYSPAEAEWPGWLFYASLQYNPRNAIWRDAPLLNEYVTRCQSILQAGEPDHDVALYWPVHDIWHDPEGMQQMLTVHHPEWLTESSCGAAAKLLENMGFGFDFVSDRQLRAGLAGSHAAIVVPETRHMPVETLRALLERADRNQPVIFLDALPADVPGFARLGERRAEFRQLLDGRDGMITRSSDLADTLAQAGAAREPMVDSGLRYIRRRHERGHHYFIANLGGEPVRAWVPLGVDFASAAILDPRSGDSGVAHRRGERDLRLHLEPGETRILRTFHEREIEGAFWPEYEATGESPVEIAGDWRIEFIDGGPELPGAIETGELKSWTELGNAEAQRFAGTARYETEFELPGETDADGWLLDLGEVRESARVKINGRDAANLWSVPFRAEVGDLLVPGKNTLQIEVTNLSANRIRALDRRGVEWQIFEEINFVNIHYQPFDASDWEPMPSGLLGPVRLIPARAQSAGGELDDLTK